MKAFATENIRNLAVIGHGDAGKTQLVSSLLHVAGTTHRWGKVDEGTTVTDYDEDSIERKVSLNNNFAHLEYKDTKINLIDTPGLCGVCFACAAGASRGRLRAGGRRRRARHRGPDRKNLAVCQRIYAAAVYGHQQDRQGARRFRPRPRYGERRALPARSCPLRCRSGPKLDFQRRCRCRPSKGLRIRRTRQSERDPDPRGRPGRFRFDPRAADRDRRRIGRRLDGKIF